MPKRLIIACDGTWNRPDQLGGPTNVLKLALAVADTGPDGARQVLLYEAGLGTRRFERLRGGAFGVGLSRNVRTCYRFVAENYEPGDQVYLFGFSRGAYTARSVAGMIGNCGILRREHVARVPEAYRLYRNRSAIMRPSGMRARIFRRMYAHPSSADLGAVHCIGVFDTVGALGIPTGAVRLPWLTRLWSFHDVQLGRHVRHAYHALAIDERRGPFRPTLWERQLPPTDQTIEQVWFSGVHCDVGGGYDDAALAEIALLWMVDRARACGLSFEPDRFALAERPAPDQRQLAAEVAPDALGVAHESRKGIYRLVRAYPRPLAGDGVAVASSAVRRRESLSDYRPQELDALLATDPPIVPVTDRPTSAP